MTKTIGIDSSTQSCKVLVVEAETGDIVSASAAGHPDGTAVDPHLWVDALRTAWAGARAAEFQDVRAVGVGGQQHGMVALNSADEPVYDALLWNDVRSAPEAREMREDLGGAAWVDAVNVVPVASFTLTKLAWLARHERAAAEQVHRVVLPHDWLNHALSGQFSTDRSDASGTAYFSAVTNEYRTDLVERYFGRVPELPPVLGPHEQAGRILPGWGLPDALLAPGAGDNAAAALGLGIRPGEVVVSIGTSGTVFASSAQPTRDPSGAVAGFADAAGGHLPLLATLNAARVLAATAGMLQVDLPGLDNLASAGDAGAAGLTLLPYLDGERTPNLPEARGTLTGLTRGNMNPENIARASVLGVLNSLADGLEALRALGVDIRTVVLVGGGAKSRSLRKAAASVFGVPVEVPATGEYVALGAARQAAWTLLGENPDWKRSIDACYEPEEGWGAEVRGRHIDARKSIYGV
ncbi:xylulokinase [Pseudarthrobacter sp. S9]|uniref:xylulokinase n=1 Tax=Pseudarthrobacter sp. S9 TaxID=3418421 RepID=UPI003CFEC763